MTPQNSTTLENKNKTKNKQLPHAHNITKGFFVKLVLMMAVDALGIYGILTALWTHSYVIMSVLVVGLLIANYVYFSAKPIPAKYLIPGMAFLLVYQVFVMGYTFYVSFTNYGAGHNSTKEDAISAIIAGKERRVPDTPPVPATVIDNGSQMGLALFKDGKIWVGSSTQILAPSPEAKGGKFGITQVPGWTILETGQILQRQQELADLRVPISENLSDGFYISADGVKATLNKSGMVYDRETDTMTDTETGTTYKPSESGNFTSEQGEVLYPGWWVFKGVENYTSTGLGSDMIWPFLSSFIWSFVFAVLSVVTTFAMGLFLALVFNDKRMKYRRLYQSLLILPYAFPAFLSTLVWKGMLNVKFGFINQIFFGGTEIPWLTNPWLAKLSILGVNMWLGFPYMFLICMGALQALPSDVMEAAKIDGAGRLRTLRSITLPLVLASTTPLLIACFAFNFNNFSLIYMLTGGGPGYPGLSKPIGQTDILISMVYKIAFTEGSQDYGLASALSIIIFVMVGIISYVGLRRSKALEAI